MKKKMPITIKAAIIAALISGCFALVIKFIPDTKKIKEEPKINKSIQTTNQSGGLNIVAETVNYIESYKFVPLNNKKKEIIINDLKKVKSKYPQKEITVKFGRVNSDEIANQIIAQLQPLIMSAGFKIDNQVIMNMGWALDTQVAMSYPPSLEEMVQDLLAALSPAIAGNFKKDMKPSHREGVIFIHIEGKPKFDKYGRAIFDK